MARERGRRQEGRKCHPCFRFWERCLLHFLDGEIEARKREESCTLTRKLRHREMHGCAQSHRLGRRAPGCWWSHPCWDSHVAPLGAGLRDEGPGVTGSSQVKPQGSDCSQASRRTLITLASCPHSRLRPRSTFVKIFREFTAREEGSHQEATDRGESFLKEPGPASRNQETGDLKITG